MHPGWRIWIDLSARNHFIPISRNLTAPVGSYLSFHHAQKQERPKIDGSSLSRGIEAWLILPVPVTLNIAGRCLATRLCEYHTDDKHSVAVCVDRTLLLTVKTDRQKRTPTMAWTVLQA